jgi:S1-C subfamily serine protease
MFERDYRNRTLEMRLPIWVIRATPHPRETPCMTTRALDEFSTALADLAAASAPAIVQVRGARRSASGVVHGPDTIVTTAGAIGRDDDLRITLPDGREIEGELAGWDPATSLAVLRTRQTFDIDPPTTTAAAPRVGQIVLAIARSWSNALTASCGAIAVVGGPLRTGHRREIAEVIRITARMHDGFAGGGVFATTGELIGIATAASIRGFGVVIPASIAWAATRQVLTSGTPARGFIGVAVQPVKLPARQQPEGSEHGLLVTGVDAPSPAETAGLLVGDVLLRFDDHALEHSEDLLDLLTDRRVGHTATVRVLRGNAVHDTSITVGSRH